MLTGAGRPKLVAGNDIRQFTMHNITLRSSPMYVIATHEMVGASFTHVTIDSNPGYGYLAAPNTDGFNVNGRDIYIGQSSVRNGKFTSTVPVYINHPARDWSFLRDCCVCR